MKRKKAAAILLYAGAVLLDTAALLTLLRGGSVPLGVIWLCLGSAALCAGAAISNRDRQCEKKGEEER